MYKRQQLAALVLLALELGRVRGTVEEAAYREILTALTEVPARIQEILQDQGAIQRAAGRHFHHRDVFFIGRGLDYPATMESSLKLKEISYIHSEAMAAGELKHGTIAMIEEGTLVIAVCTQDVLLEKMVSAIREVKARGAHVLAVTYKAVSYTHLDVYKRQGEVCHLSPASGTAVPGAFKGCVPKGCLLYTSRCV